jgi:hypothetical protein
MEMVGAVLPKEIIDLARDAIKEESKQDVAPDIKNKIFVVTENGKLNVYKGPNIITGIEGIEIMLSTEEESDPKVLLLTFNDGKKMDYLQSEVEFDIRTNGGYLIRGKQPNAIISLGGCDCRDPGAISDAQLLLTRIQKLYIVCDNRTYPVINAHIEITDTIHDKTKSSKVTNVLK